MLLILLVFNLMGCSSEAVNVENAKIDYPVCENEDSIILYDRYSEKLLSYNKETYEVEQRSNIQNFMQYEFNAGSDLYTAGNSLTNEFEIIRVKDKTIETAYTLEDKKNQAIFPLTLNEKYTLFVQTEYDELGKEIDRKVVAYENGSLTEYPEIQGLVSCAAILNDTLYYTVYVDETVYYALYEIDLTDVTSKPVFIENGLEVGELYVHDGELLKSDFDKIFSVSKEFKRMPLNYFNDPTHSLIQIFPTEEANLVLEVIDTRSSEVVMSVPNIVDFEIDGETIIVYSQGGIETIVLN